MVPADDGGMPTLLFKQILAHRFGFLLCLQGGLLLAAAFAQKTPFEEEIYLMALLGVLLGGGFSILRGTVHLVTLLVVAALAIVTNFISYFTSIEWLDVAALITSLAFMIWIFFAMVNRVFLFKRVDDNVILGAACVYIHIGMMFAFVYLLVDSFVPNSFSGIENAASDGGFSRLLEHFLYYSYVTLGTVGYGDIAPVSPVARYLSVFEAILGQLYLAIVVAKLVGMQLSSQQDK